jgi:hypothetical protein
MKFYVTYDCCFDENDGDECKENRTLYHPLNGGDWIVDDTSKDDMKLLAIISHYLDAKFGYDDDEETSNDDSEFVSDEEVIDKLLKDELLKKIGCTEDEIKKAVEEFDMNYYFPSAHSSMAEPHDYWFNIGIKPVSSERYSIDGIIKKAFKGNL